MRRTRKGRVSPATLRAAPHRRARLRGTAAPGPGALAAAGPQGEAAVVVGAESGQERVGGLRRGDAVQTQFADEAILQSLPEALDAALGLRGAGGDEADAEGVGACGRSGWDPAPRATVPRASS